MRVAPIPYAVFLAAASLSVWLAMVTLSLLGPAMAHEEGGRVPGWTMLVYTSQWAMGYNDYKDKEACEAARGAFAPQWGDGKSSTYWHLDGAERSAAVSVRCFPF